MKPLLHVTFLVATLVCAYGCSDDEPAPRGPSDTTVTPPPRPSMAPQPASDAAPAAGGPTATDDPDRMEFLGLTTRKPPGWTRKPGSSPMRVATYVVDPQDDQTEMVIFHFGPGLGGGVQANIDRWAGQFQGASGEAVTPDIQTVEVDEMDVTLVELNGAYRGMTPIGMPDTSARPDHTMVAAIVDAPVGMIFLRLLGPTASVDAHREAFRQMVEGLKRTG